MEDYKKVNVLEYVRDGLKRGTLVPREAYKFARVIARKGVLGEKVISWSVDENGKEIIEKISEVKEDPATKETEWVVTKADMEGNVIIDNNGHTNDWIIENSTFKKKYEVDPNNEGLYKPKGGIQVFVQISDNIILNQWGSDMKIAKGGYINITNPDDMYGISKRDFDDTYKYVDEIDKKTHAL